MQNAGFWSSVGMGRRGVRRCFCLLIITLKNYFVCVCVWESEYTMFMDQKIESDPLEPPDMGAWTERGPLEDLLSPADSSFIVAALCTGDGREWDIFLGEPLEVFFWSFRSDWLSKSAIMRRKPGVDTIYVILRSAWDGTLEVMSQRGADVSLGCRMCRLQEEVTLDWTGN